MLVLVVVVVVVVVGEGSRVGIEGVFLRLGLDSSLTLSLTLMFLAVVLDECGLSTEAVLCRR
jgi:hypothetical protein